MQVRSFGKLKDGRTAGLYILRNSGGMEASVSDYGAALVSLIVPDKSDNYIDVVLGHDDASGYENGHGSIGATVGRFANRIGGAGFSVGGRRCELTANNGSNCLHGGRDFYSKRLWGTKVPFTSISSKNVIAKVNAAESINDAEFGYVQDDVKGDSVTFFLDSPDGDQGFPGNLHIEVTYTLTNSGELHIDYCASSDADTPLNLTNHSYFNLNGHDSGSVLEQVCGIRAESFTPGDASSLPTGEIRTVAGTPMDFRIPRALGESIDEDYEQLRFAGGYDHNYVLSGLTVSSDGSDAGASASSETAQDRGTAHSSCAQLQYGEAASLFSAETGIHMHVLTDMPGLQLYTANGMDNEPGKGGCVYGRRCAVCFETQFWPDSVNKESFPGGLLKAGEVFRSRTTYAFSVL